MKRHADGEHIFYENPNIGVLKTLLRERHPHRLDQLTPIDFALMADGLSGIDERYGADSDTPRPYHDGRHTRDVLTDYCVYADIVELEAQDFVDGVLAAVYHDWVQDLGSGENEAASAVELGRRMDQYGYSVERQTHAQKGILVTDVVFDEDGLPHPKNLMSYGPDKMLLAMSLADMNGITLRGEGAMIDHAYRLIAEVKQLSFEQIRLDPREFVTMLVKQYPYVSERLNTLESAVRHHIEDDVQADAVLAQLAQKFNNESSMAIRAAKTIAEIIQYDPMRAVKQVAAWGEKCTNEHEFIAGLQRYARSLALGRRATKSHKNQIDK